MSGLVKHWITIICLALTSCGQLPPTIKTKPARISVLCYHHVGCFKPTPYSVSLARLDEQLNALEKEGYSFISLKDIENYYYLQTEIPSKSVAITFDDANSNVYTTAYPYLQKRGIPFAIFVYPTAIRNVHNRQFCSWPELQEMAKQGVIIGSHTYWHPYLATPKKSDKVYTPNDYAYWLNFQIAESKKTLEEHLGTSINYFALPFGLADTQAIATIKNSGYKLCFNVSGGNNNEYSDPFNINRSLVFSYDKPTRLIPKVAPLALTITTTPNNFERIYTESITISITIKEPLPNASYIFEGRDLNLKAVTPDTTGLITIPIHLRKPGVYSCSLSSTDSLGTPYKGTWLFIYNKNKPSFIK